MNLKNPSSKTSYSPSTLGTLAYIASFQPGTYVEENLTISIIWINAFIPEFGNETNL